MTAITIEQAGKIQRKMIELDPETMAEVMAWNSTALEYDILEDKKLQQKYMALLERAKKLVL